ncbi:hypothetical protein [Nostoc sp.]|uniref:hypothetical protein n=1 Tax=Nostoc sp. TaxID=1180 RepID=UPI002FF83F8E
MPEQDTRQQHIKWAKQRAIALAESGNLVDAFGSICSDLQKHPETQGHSACELGMVLYLGGHLATKEQMIEFIKGFN